MQDIAQIGRTEHIDAIFQKQLEASFELRTEPVQNRKARLQKLRKWIHANRSALHQAMFADFQKAASEVDAIEIYHVLNEIKFATANLDLWTQTKKVDAPITMLGTRSYIQYEPKGVCLIISPWNYPFSLAVGPLVSAVAAGNSVILKPSELTPNVSSLLAKMAKQLFPDRLVAVIEGGIDISQHLLKLPFNHIFFTGSPNVGKIVMKAAAEHLTSVTLELGGKSPAIITRSANIRDAAKRTAVAKFVNKGQTCVAPDYILVDESIYEKFKTELIKQTIGLFSENSSFEQSGSYCRIVNEKHFLRLNDLLHEALTAGANLEFGGKVDQASRYMHPTILSGVPLNSCMMEEEIFGPILPLIPYKTLEEAITIVNKKPKPLGLYIFSRYKSEQHAVIRETSSGGVCINDCAIHFFHHGLPFGGINHSGLGKGHGYHGFMAFSNEKPVLKQKSGFTSIQLFYPPYTAFSKKLMDWFLKLF